jgi:hypothetical protein
MAKQSPSSKEVLKPAISQEELHTVMLNNKKVQLDPKRYKNNNLGKKIKTE